MKNEIEKYPIDQQFWYQVERRLKFPALLVKLQIPTNIIICEVRKISV